MNDNEYMEYMEIRARRNPNQYTPTGISAEGYVSFALPILYIFPFLLGVFLFGPFFMLHGSITIYLAITLNSVTLHLLNILQSLPISLLSIGMYWISVMWWFQGTLAQNWNNMLH